MHSIFTLTRKKGFLTILVRTNQNNFLKWASEVLPKVIRAMWQISAVKAILVERFVTLEDALNWLSSEGCCPSCALSSSTGDGGLSFHVKGLQPVDCHCISTYMGRQEPAYNDDNALDAAVKETVAWKLFQLVEEMSTVTGAMQPSSQGVMTSRVGVLGADEDGGVTCDKGEFKLLTESFDDQVNVAEKQGKTDGRKWTEYLTEKWGKKHTMVQKATLIARCMVAFHWMCQTHHVQFEGFNEYHGRRQHVVRKKAGKLIHEQMKLRREKKKGNVYDDLKAKGDYAALKDKGEKRLLKTQKSKKDERVARGTLSLSGETKKRGARGKGKDKAKTKKALKEESEEEEGEEEGWNSDAEESEDEESEDEESEDEESDDRMETKKKEAKAGSPAKKAKTPPAKKVQKSKKKSIGCKKGRN